jgi:hypothetical protein
MFVTFISIQLVIICVVLLWRAYETHPVCTLNPGVTYIEPLQLHSNDMSRVVDQLLKLIATIIGLSRLSRSGTIRFINVYTSLLGLVFELYLRRRGLGRFTTESRLEGG